MAVTFVHIFQHWQFFLCAYGAVGRQYSVSLAAGRSSNGQIGVSCRRSSQKSIWCCRQGSKVCRSAASKAAEDGSLQAGQQKLVVILQAEQ